MRRLADGAFIYLSMSCHLGDMDDKSLRSRPQLASETHGLSGSDAEGGASLSAVILKDIKFVSLS